MSAIVAPSFSTRSLLTENVICPNRNVSFYSASA